MTQLLTQKEVASRLGLSVRSVRDLPIKRVTIGKRSVRYREADVERFIAKRAGEKAA